MKKRDNTVLICITFGFLFASLITTILIDARYWPLIIASGSLFGYFYVTHK